MVVELTHAFVVHRRSRFLAFFTGSGAMDTAGGLGDRLQKIFHQNVGTLNEVVISEVAAAFGYTSGVANDRLGVVCQTRPSGVHGDATPLCSSPPQLKPLETPAAYMLEPRE